MPLEACSGRRIELSYRLRRTNACSRERSLQRFLYLAASAALPDLKNQCRSTRRKRPCRGDLSRIYRLFAGAALRCGLSRRIIATGLPKQPSPSESRLRESPGIRSARHSPRFPRCAASPPSAMPRISNRPCSLGDNHAARPGCCRTSLCVRQVRVQKG